MNRLIYLLILLCAQPLMAQSALEGEALYNRYCATCHGVEAMGNGPMSPSLVVQPVDLTQLAKSNAGTFPVTRVVMRIDGRDPLVSHGSMMPVWGDYFDGMDVFIKSEAGQPIMTSQPIADLIAYLQTLQQE